MLASKKDLTLDSALDTVLSMEAAAKKAREMKDKGGQTNGNVHKLHGRRRSNSKGANPSLPKSPKPCQHCHGP